MTRLGCMGCGRVYFAEDEFCGCHVELVELPAATDVLAFRLRREGREDEALSVEQRRAVIEEHTR